MDICGGRHASLCIHEPYRNTACKISRVDNRSSRGSSRRATAGRCEVAPLLLWVHRREKLSVAGVYGGQRDADAGKGGWGVGGDWKERG